MTKRYIDTVGEVVREGPPALLEYLRAFYWLWTAASPLKARNLDADTFRHVRPGSRPPTRPVAASRFDQEISWLKRQARDIHVYLDDPEFVPPPAKAKRRCSGCKRGLSNSWVYCPMCGKGTVG